MVKNGRTYVIGVDEAGYGPNLGPLAIGASVWQIPSSIDLCSLAVQLEPEFQAKRLQTKERQLFVPLGDSKELYQSGVSTESLELGVLSLLQNARNFSSTMCRWSDLLRHADCLKLQPLSHQKILPWYADLANATSMDGLDSMPYLVGLAQNGLAKIDVAFEGFQARLVDEILFNQGLNLYGSKGRLLSLTTLELVKDVISSLALTEVDRIEIYCDRHGGRSKYLELLHMVFEDVFFWIDGESPQESCYRTEWEGCPVRIRFTVGGDRFPPTSAASMLAKWLREVSMHRFNAYWRAYVHDIRPTAGYPVDAKRFVAELASSKIWELDQQVPQLETIWRRA